MQYGPSIGCGTRVEMAEMTLLKYSEIRWYQLLPNSLRDTTNNSRNFHNPSLNISAQSPTIEVPPIAWMMALAGIQ